MRICIRILVLGAALAGATLLAADADHERLASAQAGAAAPAAAGPMILRYLRADGTEDVANDEPYVKVNGKKVWGPRSIDKGQTRPVGVVVRAGDTVSLYDEDLGGLDSDDHLGDAQVSAGPSGVLTFDDDGAAYTLGFGPLITDFQLTRGAMLNKAIDMLDERLRKSGVQKLLRKANRRLTTRRARGCPPKNAAVPRSATVYCLKSGDNKTAEWFPQGMTTSSDANADERWGRRQALIVTWYDKRRKPEKGARLSFVDLQRKRYRHVLLVKPTVKQGKPTYGAINFHAGGIAWYGNYLYVADTKVGLRVFDLREIFDLGLSKNGTTRNRKRIGLKGKTYYGAGNRYVLPQLTTFANRAKPKTPCSGVGPPVHSWVSVDRSQRPDVLMTGEYCDTKGDRGRIGLWRLRDLDPEGPGIADAEAANYLPPHDGRPTLRVQGGTASHGTYWFTRNVAVPKGEPAKPGKLVSVDWTAGGVWHNRDDKTIAKGPEDLSCWRSTSRLWTVAEHPKRRALYALRDARCR